MADAGPQDYYCWYCPACGFELAGWGDPPDEEPDCHCDPDDGDAEG